MDTQDGGGVPALIASELEIPESGRLGLAHYWRLSSRILLRIDDPSGNTAALDRIGRRPPLTGIAVLIGARRTPIRAIALMLERITRAAGANIEILVLLVHAAAEEVSARDIMEKLATWRTFLAIHDLHVGLERWPR